MDACDILRVGGQVMRVLIVDDHTLIADTLSYQFQRTGDEAVTAQTIGEAIAALDDEGALPDVILLDYYLPDTKGLDGLRSLVEAAETTPVVLMSGDAGHGVIRTARTAGASGFVSKATRVRQLRSILQTVIDGCPYFPPEVFSNDGEPYAQILERLSPVNVRILALLGRGCTNREIGFALDMEDYNVKAHLRTIFRALGVTNRTQAALIAEELGVVDEV